MTSLQALKWGPNSLQPEMRLLVIGASGGCGLAALQLARALGTKAIVAVCSASSAELCLTHGATRVVDYTQDNFSLPELFGKSVI